MKHLFLVTLLIVVSTVKAEGSNYVICKNKKIVRTIAVDDHPQEKKCVTRYTKSGVEKVVAQGQSRVTCEGVMKNIKANLESSAWKCREISNVQVQESQGL